MRKLAALGLCLSALVSMSAVLATSAWASGAPVNLTLPSTEKLAIEGTVAEANVGTWSNSPTSYTYQWQRCSGTGTECANISGATRNYYAINAPDVGHALVVKVTAHNALGEATAVSAATKAVLESTLPEVVPTPTEKSPLLILANGGISNFRGGPGSWYCNSSHLSGEFVGKSQLAQVQIKFSECGSEFLGGTFTTEKLRGYLFWIDQATHQVGVELQPESGSVFVNSFWKGFPVKGSVYGQISPINTAGASFTLTYAAGEAGHQRIGPASQLTMDEYPFSIESTFALSTSSKVEIKG
jgi:hypothetical protein